jgi:hypothetical protein
MINPGMVLQTNSFTYHIRNYTALPVFIADGTGGGVKILHPLMNRDGSYRPDMQPEWAGKVVAIRANTVESPAQIGVSIQYDTQNILWDIIATPPFIEKDMKTWCVISKEFNIVIAGNPGLVDNFVKQYRSVYDYMKTTDFGTRFKNSLNYGIFNRTGKQLFQVDDTGVDDFGTSDIITIPFGENITVPIFKQQRAQNMYNVDESRPFIRVYRYEFIYTDDKTIWPTMRERIYYWSSEDLTEDGFMYLRQFHACLFDTQEAAQEFINKYQTVENYETELYKADHYEAITEYAEGLRVELNKKYKLVIKGCAIFVSLQLVWKLGELIVWAVKENVRNNRQTRKNGNLSGKQSFINAPFSTDIGFLNSIGSTFL